MTGKHDDAASIREDSFLAELVPQVAERLAEQYAADYDAGVDRERFLTWLAAHTKEPVVPAKGRASTGYTRPTDIGWIGRFPMRRLLGFSAAFCGIVVGGGAVAALVAFASTTILVFLVGTLLGALAGGVLCVRYLRQEIAANIGPRLQHIESLLHTLQAELHLDIATRLTEKISGRSPGDPPTGW